MEQAYQAVFCFQMDRFGPLGAAKNPDWFTWDSINNDTAYNSMKGSGKRSGKNASPTRPSEANISDATTQNDDIRYNLQIWRIEQINQKTV